VAGGEKVEELKDEADTPAVISSQPSPAGLGQIQAIDHHASRARTVETGDQVEQR
jgi:hypothetical protein